MFFNKNLQEQDQYHKTIRSIVVVVGSLFSDMILVRENHKTKEIEEKIRVPVTFANRDKMLTLVREAPTVEGKNTSFTLPRIGFSFEGLSYDSQRQLPKTGGRSKSSNDPKNALMIYNPVPYNFEFNVSIVAKYAEDLTQLVEKILPYFSPNLNVTYKAIPEVGLDVDLPIILNNVSWQDDYTGLEERRIIMAELSLTVKGYLFPPIKDYPKIQKVFVETQFTADVSRDMPNEVLKTENHKLLKTESSGAIHAEDSSLSNVKTEASLVKVYGYIENDDFGFQTFIYEGDEYDEEREREALKEEV